MQFSLDMGKTLFLKMHKYAPRPSLSWGPLRVIVPVVESLGGISTLTPVVCKISAMVLPRWPITYLCCDFGTSTDTNVHFFSYNYKNTLTRYIQATLHAFAKKMFCSELNTCVILSWIHKQTHHFLMDTQDTFFSCHHSFLLSCNGYFIFLYRQWRDIDSYTCLIHKSSHLFIMRPTDKRMVHLWYGDTFICLFGLKTFG